MKRMIYFLFLHLVLCHLYSQSITISPDTVMHRLWKQTRILPREKLYVSTDKPTYICGERIWFRAFVVNAISHQPEQASRYVYVELVNPFDSIVYRVRARQDEQQLIYGHIALEHTLPAGNYSLRAYTRYMKNNSDSCFFRKPISISSPLEKAIRINSQFDRKSVTLHFINPQTQKEVPLNNITAYTDKKQLRLNKENEDIRFYLDEADLKYKVILVKADNYSRFIPADMPIAPEFHIDFLPEGGQLIQGAVCKVGFKALNADGTGENITGIILDNDNQIITRIQSIHRGMGSFSFTPQEGKTYYAECENEHQLKTRFQLPETLKNGYALQVSRYDTTIQITVNGTDTNPTDSLMVLIHQRGHPLYAQSWKSKNGILALPQADFFTGIAHILLLDNRGYIRSERMVFTDNSEIAQANVKTIKTTYTSREKVSMTINLTDKEGNPLDGNCTIAVTDDQDVKPDSCITILSYLLIRSELKGYIEDPNWYFRHKNREEAEAALDVLLLTQGWRQYPIENIIQRNYLLPKIQPETSMEITGRVSTALTGKPINQATIRIAVPARGMTEELHTDKDGRFQFEGFEFPDSTTYLIAAYSQKKKDNIVLKIETENFPTANNKTSFGQRKHSQHSQERPPSVELLSKVGNQLAYESGIRHILMDEVTITARQKIEYKTIYQRWADRTMTEQQIRESMQPNIGNMMASNFGLWYKGGALQFRGGDVLILLDGVWQEGKSATFILENFPVTNIKQIDILKGQANCAGYAPGFAGFPEAIVAITTKSGCENSASPSLNIAKIEPLGYQEPIAFYSPKYETAIERESSKPDLRTTIYWKPNTCIKNGKAEISFYTADAETSYSIVTEGISNKGVTFRTTIPLEIHANK